MSTLSVKAIPITFNQEGTIEKEGTEHILQLESIPRKGELVLCDNKVHAVTDVLHIENSIPIVMIFDVNEEVPQWYKELK